jgi:hypothetical protein
MTSPEKPPSFTAMSESEIHMTSAFAAASDS